MDQFQVIARELSLPESGVRAVLELFKEGGTVPFIARYRKEKTGALDEVQIRSIQERSEYLGELEERRAAILKSIDEQGKLSPELKAKIEATHTKNELEDLYLPYKPKRVTRAQKAKELGLEPLADLAWAQGDAQGFGAAEPPQGEGAASPKGEQARNYLAEIAKPFVSEEKGVHTTDQAWAGARDILAERIADDAGFRGIARSITVAEGDVATSVLEEKKAEKSKYEGYYDHKEAVAKIPSHRYLAIRRGEKEGFLRVSIAAPEEKILARIEKAVVTNAASPFAAELKKAVGDAYARLIAPSIENEIREDLKEKSDEAAIEVFAVNVRNLLLASPLGSKTVLGLDPGFRTGVKVAVIDKTGKVLEHVAIFPHGGEEKGGKGKGKKDAKAKKNGKEASTDEAPKAEATPGPIAPIAAPRADGAEDEVEAAPADIETAEGPRDAEKIDREDAKPEKPEEPSKAAQKRMQAKVVLGALMEKHGVEAIAIGNGTAGRETEAFVDEFIKEWAEPAGKKLVKVMVSESGASIYSASDVAREEFPDLDITVRGAISIGRRLQDPLAELVKIDPRSIGVGQYQHDVNQSRLKRKLTEVVESAVNLVGVDVNTASAPLLSYVAGIGPSLAKRMVKDREQKGPFSSRENLKRVTLFGEKAFEQSAGFLRVRGGSNPLDDSAVHPEAYLVVERMAKDLGVEAKDLVGKSELVSKIDVQKYVDEIFGAMTLKDILAELEKPGRDPRAEFSGPAFRADVTDIRDLAKDMILDGIVTNVTNFGAFVDVGVHQDGLVHVSEISHQYVKDPTEAIKVGDLVKVKVLGVDGDKKRISLSIKQTQPAPPREARGPRGRGGERGPRPEGGRGGGPRGERRPRPEGAQAREGGRPGARPGGDRGPRPGGDRGPRPAGADARGPGGPGARPGGGGGRGPRPDFKPKKVGTHGRKEERKRDSIMGGPERGPREPVPKQKKPDNSLGALFGDLLKDLKDEKKK